MWNAGLDEAQAGIKTAGRNINNNLRYADNTTLMEESEELKQLLMKVKEENFKIFFLKMPRQHIKKERHYFADKGPSSQSYGFSSSHVGMQELNHKESWAPKNWCFWTVVLEKTP